MTNPSEMGRGDVVLKVEAKGPDGKGMRAEFFEDGSMVVHGDDGHEAQSMVFAKACWEMWTTLAERVEASL